MLIPQRKSKEVNLGLFGGTIDFKFADRLHIFDWID